MSTLEPQLVATQTTVIMRPGVRRDDDIFAETGFATFRSSQRRRSKHSRSRDMKCPSDIRWLALAKHRGRREGRVPVAPAVRVQQKSTAAEPQVTAETTGLPCAMVLTLIRDLPGDRRSCPRRPRRSSKHRNLGISTGMPGPHDFAVRDMSFVRAYEMRCDMSRPSHLRPNARDDREAPLSSGRDATNVPVICPTRQARRPAAK